MHEEKTLIVESYYYTPASNSRNRICHVIYQHKVCFIVYNYSIYVCMYKYKKVLHMQTFLLLHKILVFFPFYFWIDKTLKRIFSNYRNAFFFQHYVKNTYRLISCFSYLLMISLDQSSTLIRSLEQNGWLLNKSAILFWWFH